MHLSFSFKKKKQTVWIFFLWQIRLSAPAAPHSALNLSPFWTLAQTISRSSYGSFVTHLNCCYSPVACCSMQGPLERRQLTLHNSTTHWSPQQQICGRKRLFFVRMNKRSNCAACAMLRGEEKDSDNTVLVMSVVCNGCRLPAFMSINIMLCWAHVVAKTATLCHYFFLIQNTVVC